MACGGEVPTRIRVNGYFINTQGVGRVEDLVIVSRPLAFIANRQYAGTIMQKPVDVV